jgi:heat shock protein HspQ
VHAILESKFQDWIDAKVIVGDLAKTWTFAFLGVVDSIMLELVYGNDEKWLKDKLEASWTVLWRDISQQ